MEKNWLGFCIKIMMVMLLLMNTAEAQTKRKEKNAPIPIIDAHTHTDFSDGIEPTSKIPMTREQYFKEWVRAGIVGAIAHTASETEPLSDLRSRNVINCMGISAVPNVSAIEEGLRSGKYGCIKIYLGYIHQYAYDTNYEPAYQLAEKYDVPVVFHTGDTYSSKAKLKYADPLTIDEVAVDHPKVRFVLAHCGNPWIESAAEVAYKNPNVYLEGSAFLIGNLDKASRSKVDESVVRPLSWIFNYVEDPTKLMFGSDWPLVDVESYVTAFKRAIPKEHWRAVFYENAARVFKFNPDLVKAAPSNHRSITPPAGKR
jgi:uncharacterized protein